MTEPRKPEHDWLAHNVPMDESRPMPMSEWADAALRLGDGWVKHSDGPLMPALWFDPREEERPWWWYPAHRFKCTGLTWRIKDEIFRIGGAGWSLYLPVAQLHRVDCDPPPLTTLTLQIEQSGQPAGGDTPRLALRIVSVKMEQPIGSDQRWQHFAGVFDGQ